jgi:hypothetical protein
MASLADQESAIEDFMEVLTAHRKNCERLGRFVEAEIARKRLEELKQHEEGRRREMLRTRQMAEVLAVEEAHVLEFQEFNKFQDAKMSEFERHAQSALDAMRLRHQGELRDFQQRLLSKDMQARHSKEYYTLRDVQEKLASGKNYAGAAKIKEKADELMAYEEEKHINEHHLQMMRKEKEYKEKLTLEAETFKKRIAQNRAEAGAMRQKELEQLLLRYNNVKKELETRHRSEKLKLDKEISLEQKRGEMPSGAPPKKAAANTLKPSFQTSATISKKGNMVEDAAGTLLSKMGRKGLVAIPSPYETIQGKR